ncbi:VOC family protein [Streptomyces sp. NPDC047081]|uniref:VOC family protein n=1 Tax=Streptomyces sp. NPDC047081 TaxID=3154706 RepID=UPI0034012DC1
MSLHGLTHVTIAVPNPDETADYYDDFGLTQGRGLRFSTSEGGEQLRITSGPRRRLEELGVGADDADDVARIASSLTALGYHLDVSTIDSLAATDPATGIRVRVAVAPRIQQERVPATPYNGPGRVERLGRAPGVLRGDRVRPRRLGHAVSGTPDLQGTMRFFVEGLGFQVSDYIGDKGAFLRCSTDHHNFLALAAPISYLHHTSWQVSDVDDVGRGAYAMLENNPERHVWGLGRHHAGSNFFWYLKDPAGNFSEYFADMDHIPEDELWTPESLEGAKGLFNWGPPPPPSFLAPDDLAGLMTGAHSA